MGKNARVTREAEVSDAMAELDLSEQTIRRDLRRGAPHSRGTRNRVLFNIPEYRQWRLEHGLNGERGRPVEGDSPDLEAARLRKENALAAKYELQVERERKEVIPNVEIKEMGARAFTAARNRLAGAGAALAPILEGKDAAERQDAIDQYNRDILSQLEVDLRKLG